VEEIQTEVAPETAATAERRPAPLQFLVDVLESLLILVVLIVGINTISARIRVDGSSMEPTLHGGEFVFVDTLSYKIAEPRRGDVIVFHFPRDPRQEYIKRVIGLPGDEVEMNAGQVFVNGQPINEPTMSSDPAFTGKWKVAGNTLFVLGDNRSNSSDSRSWGNVPFEYVVGKALLVYWPPQSWGSISHNGTMGSFNRNLIQAEE
jgi:signal peptidase I